MLDLRSRFEEVARRDQQVRSLTLVYAADAICYSEEFRRRERQRAESRLLVQPGLHGPRHIADKIPRACYVSRLESKPDALLGKDGCIRRGLHSPAQHFQLLLPLRIRIPVALGILD